jgi:isopenicillin N synthase-like dioxygenase
MLEYFQTMDKLYLRLLRMLSIGLQLPDPDYLVKQCNQQHENLRLVHYHSLPPAHPSKMIRGNVNTDFGVLTLVVQDHVGGLQFKGRDGDGWINVEPVPYAIVVNVGDMLMRWSNDRIKASLHQVVTPSWLRPGDRIPERFSIVFFCNANKNAILKCLETCQSDTNPAKYPPINAHKYLTQRLSDIIASSK